MAKCEACGNDYDKAFQVIMKGNTYTFDSFECAIHVLAPHCDNCGIHIVGHGLAFNREVKLAAAACRASGGHKSAPSVSLRRAA